MTPSTLRSMIVIDILHNALVIMATQNDWTKITYITKNWSSVKNTVL